MSAPFAYSVQSIGSNASTAAADLLREAILDGRLVPGQRLKEVELAERFGISRTPIREALLYLQAEGSVLLTPNRGATVRSYSSSEIEDTYDLRALLESHAARRAATRLSDENIEELKESCERFSKLPATEAGLLDLVEENNRFHNVILESSGSPQLERMVRSTIQMPLVYKAFLWYSPDQTRISQHYHEQIARAVALRDGDRAERLMMEHVLGARDFLVAAMRDAENRSEVAAP